MKYIYVPSNLPPLENTAFWVGVFLLAVALCFIGIYVEPFKTTENKSKLSIIDYIWIVTGSILIGIPIIILILYIGVVIYDLIKKNLNKIK